eukprot:10131354-Prorocentrum_lima.AAC.1
MPACGQAKPSRVTSCFSIAGLNMPGFIALPACGACWKGAQQIGALAPRRHAAQDGLCPLM